MLKEIREIKTSNDVQFEKLLTSYQHRQPLHLRITSKERSHQSLIGDDFLESSPHFQINGIGVSLKMREEFPTCDLRN